MNIENLGSVNIEKMNIKTRGVEAALAPIVKQIRKLINPTTKRKKKGQSKKALILVQALQVATDNFVWRGESIANEVPEAMEDVIAAVTQIRACGSKMTICATEFAADPCNQDTRYKMIVCARELLAAVARLLIIADMIDVHILMGAIYTLNTDLDFMRELSSPSQLVEGMRRFEKSANHLGVQAGRRQAELKDKGLQESLASARAVLKKTTPLLFTASNVHVRYPAVERSRENRDLVIKDICKAVDTIGEIAEGKKELSNHLQPQSLLESIGELRVCLQNNPHWNQNKPFIEERFNHIGKRVKMMTESDQNIEIQDKLERIFQDVKECLNLQMSTKKEDFEKYGQRLIKLLDLLSMLIRRIILNQVSAGFLEILRPINSVVSMAKKGKENETIEKTQLLRNQCDMLTATAAVVTQLNMEDDQRKLIELAASQLQNLCDEVVNAGLILADIPKSRAALENMDAFKKAWVSQVRILVDAVDEILPLGQLLDVLENDIINDVRSCCKAVGEKNPTELTRSSRSVYHRTLRVCDLAVSDLENFEHGDHSERLLEAIESMKNDIFPLFARRVQTALKAMKTGGHIDQNEFIDGTRMVYDGFRDVKRVVTAYIEQEEEFNESDWEMLDQKQAEKDPSPPKLPKIAKKEVQSIRDAVKNIPEQDKLEIAKELEIDSQVYWVAIWSDPRVRNLLSTTHLGGSQVDGFHEEKENFDREVDKWEDAENDIVLLAKHMCRIMTDMTDFIKGKGPIKCTQDIITSAKKISDFGKKLDCLARRIAENCPQSSTKSDLLAYLQRIALYCHQLNITSKVKSDVHNVSGEFIVSGLDSACSLIQAARNLMNAVVLTVKASYVASRMYKPAAHHQGHDDSFSSQGGQVVVWKMKTPEKKPLVKRELLEDYRAKLKRCSKKEQTSPMKALSEFEEDGLLSFSAAATSTESLASSTAEHK